MPSYVEETEQDIIVGSALQLFKTPQRLFQFTSVEQNLYEPVIRAENSGTVVFDVPPSQFMFTLPRLELSITFRVVLANGDTLPHPTTVAPVDQIGFSMWRSCKVRLNEHAALQIIDYFPTYTYVMNRLVYSEVCDRVLLLSDHVLTRLPTRRGDATLRAWRPIYPGCTTR